MDLDKIAKARTTEEKLAISKYLSRVTGQRVEIDIVAGKEVGRGEGRSKNRFANMGRPSKPAHSLESQEVLETRSKTPTKKSKRPRFGSYDQGIRDAEIGVINEKLVGERIELKVYPPFKSLSIQVNAPVDVRTGRTVAQVRVETLGAIDELGAAAKLCRECGACWAVLNGYGKEDVSNYDQIEAIRSGLCTKERR